MYAEIEQKVLAYCREQKMFTKGTVLIALSGGGDSVALLQILLNISGDLGISVEAAHLNHALRDEESDEDEIFCCELCDELNVPLIVERLTPGEISSSADSLETAARNARIVFLQNVAQTRNATRIATGHTNDDQAETILQRILRGTGPSGLTGILPVREGFWIRPLLSVSRKEVRNYLINNGIRFREDSTNRDTRFIRNRIRHELLPLLRERFSPNVEETLSRLATLSRTQEEYLEIQTQKVYSECLIHEDNAKILLDKSRFMRYHIYLQQRIVRHCLTALEGAGRDTDVSEIETILSLFTNDHAIADITSRLKCEINENLLTFALQLKPLNPVLINVPGETEIPFDGGHIISETTFDDKKADGTMSVLFSSEIIEKYGPLTVGFVRPGDTMVPYGMRGAVKVRDIFASVSLPRILRDYVPIVRAGAVPVWIPGIRSSVYSGLRSKNLSSGDSIFCTYLSGIQWC